MLFIESEYLACIEPVHQDNYGEGSNSEASHLAQELPIEIMRFQLGPSRLPPGAGATARRWVYYASGD